MANQSTLFKSLVALLQQNPFDNRKSKKKSKLFPIDIRKSKKSSKIKNYFPISMKKSKKIQNFKTFNMTTD